MEAEFNQNDIKFLAKSLKSRVLEFNRNETILTDTSDENKIAFVLSGVVYLCSENDLYERSILRFFREGEMLSTHMLPDEALGVSYFIAKTPVSVVIFSRDDVWALAASGSAWRDKLSALMSTQLEKAFAHSSIISHQRSIRERVIMFLKQQSLEQGSATVNIPMPFSDLAEYLATERSALMRELGKMKQDGIITGKNRTITLLKE